MMRTGEASLRNEPTPPVNRTETTALYGERAHGACDSIKTPTAVLRRPRFVGRETKFCVLCGTNGTKKGEAKQALAEGIGRVLNSFRTPLSPRVNKPQVCDAWLV